MTAETANRRSVVRSSVVPQRILLVDDDELELELMADRLQTAGFEIATASNGNEALERLTREWFPLVITDREMPFMNGLELTEQLRARGVDDIYVIMLTVRDAGADYERGYLAGADDYVTKKTPDADLLARVRKAFQTIAIRRLAEQTQARRVPQESFDSRSGAYTREHLLSALRSECRRAERYERTLSVMTVAINGHTSVADATLRQVAESIRAAVRAHADWIACLDGTNGETVFVVVLPEAAAAAALTIKTRLQRALRHFSAVTGTEGVSLSFGFASLDAARADRKPVEPEQLIRVAEQCRACLCSRGALQLAAVQASVAQGLSTFCRHGYAVESHCRFIAEPLHLSAENTAA